LRTNDDRGIPRSQYARSLRPQDDESERTRDARGAERPAAEEPLTVPVARL